MLTNNFVVISVTLESLPWIPVVQRKHGHLCGHAILDLGILTLALAVKNFIVIFWACRFGDLH